MVTRMGRVRLDPEWAGGAGERRAASGAEGASTDGEPRSGEQPAGAPTLVMGGFYKMAGIRWKYLGRGVSGLHWFEMVEGGGGVTSMEDGHVRALLTSGKLAPCPPG